MKKYIIYLHRNRANGKCYVGQTCQKPEVRWGLHGNGYKSQEYFYRAIQKYGWDNFEHIILEDNLTAEEANQQEIFWAGYYHALVPEGYCLQVGQENQKTISNLARQHYQQATLKQWESLDYRKKIINGRQTMWHEASQETKEKMLANLDHSGKNGKIRSKKVECIETKEIYASTREAERITGIKHNNISQVCTGKRKTAGRYHWRYVE